MAPIIHFKTCSNYTQLCSVDDSGRDIGFSKFDNVALTGRSNSYPNILLRCFDQLINPYDEKVMSLGVSSFYGDNYEPPSFNLEHQKLVDEGVFFFLYNFENYFHFVYDTLPYLYTFFRLKEEFQNLKLLVSDSFYQFNTEFLEKLVSRKDWVIHSSNNVYKSVYVSTSLTHGGHSNNPPRPEIKKVYERLVENINLKNISNHICDIKKFYVSRRTWIKETNNNIGTDYTTRRKMINENEIVEMLEQYGFKEIFTEDLNTDEKLYLFSNAKVVVGSIGGGMVNLLFSKPTTTSIILVSPNFLKINERFKFCLDTTNSIYFMDVEHAPYNEIPLYTRVKITNKTSDYYERLGEISEYCNGMFCVRLSNNDVAGFRSDREFPQSMFLKDELEPLDWGLNSPYIVDKNKLKNVLENV